jgi:hypothetical protein
MNMSPIVHPRLFINYRVDDTGSTASTLYRELNRVLAPGQVFFDQEQLAGGDIWPQRLREEVLNCTVMLSLIGSRWLTVQDPRTGDRRLNLPNDWVRKEIETAMEAGKVIIPVLVDGIAPLPEDALQTIPSIKNFTKLHTGNLRHRDWLSDFNSLLALLCDSNGFARKSDTGRIGGRADLGLSVEIDRASPLIIMQRGRTKAFGTTNLPDGSLAFGEGVTLRLTLDNPCNFDVVVKSLDLHVSKFDPYPVDAPAYPEVAVSGIHLEMPSSIRSKPIELSAQQTCGADQPIVDGRLLLASKGTVDSCHTLNFQVRAKLSGLWEVRVIAKISDMDGKRGSIQVTSDPIIIAKR